MNILGFFLGMGMAIVGIIFFLWDIVMLVLEDPRSSIYCLIANCDKNGFDGTEGLLPWGIICIIGAVLALSTFRAHS